MDKFDNNLIDGLIDEIFAEEGSELVEKSMDAPKTADEAVKDAPKAQKDEARGAGRPKQISDIPEEDEDGKREGNYDADITSNKDKEDEPEETKQVEAPKAMKKSVSASEWAEFQAWKAAQAENMAKSESEEDESLDIEALVKSQVEVLAKAKDAQIEDLKKSLQETQALVKAIANKPMPQKSIDSIQVLEKSGDKQPETFSKSEMLDVAFDIAMKKSYGDDFTELHVTELENSGYIVNPDARKILESELKKRK